MNDSVWRSKSKTFAIRIVKLYKHLRETKNEYVMSKQLLRCGTSIGANIAEGYYGQSEPDFVSKMSIAQKECSETLYWLELLHDTEYISDKEFESIYSDAVEMIKLLTSTIKTMKNRMQKHTCCDDFS